MTIFQIVIAMAIAASACVGGLLYAVLRERSDHRARGKFHGNKW
jgi:hypothetical protein